jgi:hypothetical protein
LKSLGKLGSFNAKTISGNEFATIICDTLSAKIQRKKYIVRASK